MGSYYGASFSNSYNLNGKFLFYFRISSQFINHGGEFWATDGTSAGTFLVTAITDYEDFGLRLFPNPASHTLQIASAINEDLSVCLFDLRGSMLSSFFLKANAMVTHDVSQYATGLYVVRVSSKRGVIAKKFVKR